MEVGHPNPVEIPPIFGEIQSPEVDDMVSIVEARGVRPFPSMQERLRRLAKQSVVRMHRNGPDEACQRKSEQQPASKLREPVRWVLWHRFTG